MELQMYVEFNLATSIKLCWWPEVSGRLPAGLLRDARIHSQTQIFKTENIFPSSFGSGIIAKETSAANSAFLFLHWRKHKAKTVSSKGGTQHGNMRRPQMPRIWHPAGEAHGPSQHPSPGTAQSPGDGWGLEQEAEPPIPGSSPLLPLWQWATPGITAVSLQRWSHNLKAELGYF